MPTRVVLGVVPPGGWHFTDDDVKKLRGHPIQGAEFNDLVDRVTQFRIENDLSIGRPEADVEDYICKAFPRHCRQNRKAQTRAANPPSTFHEKIHAWLNKRYSRIAPGSKGLEYVDLDVSEKRASICVQCPHNRPWKSSCAPCNSKTGRLSVIVRQNRRTTRHAKLLGCAIGFHENASAVVLEERFLRHRKFYSGWPSFCWLAKLKEE